VISLIVKKSCLWDAWMLEGSLWEGMMAFEMPMLSDDGEEVPVRCYTDGMHTCGSGLSLYHLYVLVLFYMFRHDR
jgi:hypothetical protein